VGNRFVLNGTFFASDITKEIGKLTLDFVPDYHMVLVILKKADSRNTFKILVSECIEKGNPTLGMKRVADGSYS